MSPRPPREPLVRVELHPHPSTPGHAVESLHVALWVGSDAITVEYVLDGDVERLRVPEPGAELDPARLWEHTCFELFVAEAEGEGYVEHNLSSTGQRARFEHSGYRQRVATLAPASGDAPTVVVEPRRLRLRAAVPSSDVVAGEARLSPTAVIEDAEGGLSYWALRHPSPRPDFHHSEGFALQLTLEPTPTITIVTEPP